MSNDELKGLFPADVPEQEKSRILQEYARDHAAQLRTVQLRHFYLWLGRKGLTLPGVSAR